MAPDLLADAADARRTTLALVADLSDGQLDVSVADEVNPFRWELGHVAFFYDAMVLGHLLGAPPAPGRRRAPLRLVPGRP